MRTVRTPYVPYRAFGSLGGNTTTIGTGAAQGAAAGATVGGPIGAVVGGVVGAIAGVFGGQSNPQINIDKTNAIQLFSQYSAVMGTVPGRSIGLENMDMVLRGACFQGHFPSWGNSTELPDSLLSLPGSPYGQNDNCFAVLWSYAQTGRPAPGGSGQYTGNNGVPVKDAKTFVDKYVWPSNSPNVDTNPWVTNTDSIGKQVIYDCADAYIATQTSGTIPYIANPQVATAPAAPARFPALVGVPAPAPAAAAPTNQSQTVSPNGSYLVQTALNNSFITPQGTWMLDNSGVYSFNGAPTTRIPAAMPAGMVGTLGLLYYGGQVYAYNADGKTYVWTGNGYQATNTAPTPPAVFGYSPPGGTSTQPVAPVAATAKPVQPPRPTAVESTDGAQVTAPGTALETQAGTLIYLGPQAQGDPNNATGGYPIWENNTQNGYAIGLLMLNGGNVYALNNSGMWFQWGANNWSILPGPPTVQTAPTTSTVASPQATVCTPKTTAGGATAGSGQVIGSTVSGEPITSSDIQAMIQQLQNQGATQAQANAAILQALQSQGASLTSGLQSAIGSQVAQSLPPTAAAAPAVASSNTGLYIVAGGLALIGVMWMMNRRRV